MIIAGYGCIQAGAREVVADLSATFDIPVTTSLKAKGVVGDGTPLSLGCLGVTSNGDAYRYIIEHADLLMFLGAGFNERTSYLWDANLLAGKKVAQIDHDAAQLEKVFQPDVAILGDISAVMEACCDPAGRRHAAKEGPNSTIPAQPSRRPQSIKRRHNRSST